MNRYLVAILVFITLPFVNQAQKILLLERPGTTRYIIYKAGAPISVVSYVKKLNLSGTITHIEDTIVFINNVAMPLSEIQIVIRDHKFLYKLKGAALVAGVGYLAISLINRSINKDYPVIDRTVPVVSGSSAAIIGISLLTEYRKYKIGYKWHLKVIDLSILKVKPGDFR